MFKLDPPKSFDRGKNVAPVNLMLAVSPERKRKIRTRRLDRFWQYSHYHTKAVTGNARKRFGVEHDMYFGQSAIYGNMFRAVHSTTDDEEEEPES